MVVSVVQSIGFFSLRQAKKLLVSVVFGPSHDFVVFKYVKEVGEIEWIKFG